MTVEAIELDLLADDGCPHTGPRDDRHERAAALRTQHTPERDAELALGYWDSIHPEMSDRELAEAICSLASRAEPLARHALSLLAKCAALQRFKEYVHTRLDNAGVPVDPDSPHRAEGCRIGGRLDAVFAEQNRLRSEIATLREQAARVLFWRETSGAFVDGFRAQEELNKLAELLAPAGKAA